MLDDSKYAYGDLLGCGKFGKVYQAIDLKSGRLLAVKIIKLKNIGDEKLGLIRNKL